MNDSPDFSDMIWYELDIMAMSMLRSTTRLQTL